MYGYSGTVVFNSLALIVSSPMLMALLAGAFLLCSLAMWVIYKLWGRAQNSDI